MPKNVSKKLLNIEKKIVELEGEELKEYVSNLPKKDVESIVEYLSRKYYEPEEGEESIVSDEKFDMLKERYTKLFPKKHKVGAKLRDEDNSVKLPFYLGSLDKVKPSDEAKLDKWLENYTTEEYIISEKLDGISCLLIMNDSGEIKLYTRGDGFEGKDISYLLPDINHIPHLSYNLAVRGELIVSKKNFEAIRESSEQSEEKTRLYKNPRNMVAGITGAKTARLGLAFIDYVVYEIVGSGEMPKPSENFEELERLGFKVAQHEIVNEISVPILSSLLNKFRKKSEYEIDGIVIQGNTSYFRNESGNPDYAFAFKLPGETAIVVVKGVEWEVSKHGLLKPVVVIDPIDLSGVTIARATGFNAKFIEENGIGVGAKIEIIRSGEVIPYILRVIKKTTPDLPEEGSYTWNETHVDIITTNLSDEKICIKIINNFMKELDIKYVSEATITRLFHSGLDTLIKILSASAKDFAKIEGLGAKSGERIYENIHTRLLSGLTMEEIMASSGLFGFGIGKRKLKLLVKKYPNPIEAYDNLGREKFQEEISNIEGYAEKTAKRITNTIEAFRVFYDRIREFIKVIAKKVSKTSSLLSGKKVVMSGFRDPELKEKIEQLGGSVMTSVSGKTNILIIANKGQMTGKVEKAREKGVEIMIREEFERKYLGGEEEEKSEEKSEEEEEKSEEEKREAEEEEHEADWEVGDDRPFAFDPNSTKNEGRFRLVNPKGISGYFRKKDKDEEGISYVMGRNEDGSVVVQAIRFDLSLWSEKKAKTWWKKNAKRFNRKVL